MTVWSDDPLRTLHERPVATRSGERIALALERIATALEAQNAMSGFLDAALKPEGRANQTTSAPVTVFDWYRTTDGEFRVRTAAGDREPTRDEAALLQGTLPRGERRR